MRKIYCPGLVNVLLLITAGCSVGAPEGATHEPTIGIASQAATAPYTTNVNTATQAIELTTIAPADWVDLHLTVASASGNRVSNLRMAGVDTYFRVGPIPMIAGDTLSYAFTYSVNGVASDTPRYSYRVPLDYKPQALDVRVGTAFGGGRELQVAMDPFWGALAWGDLHYTVNSGTPRNVRATPLGGFLVEPLSLVPGDVVRFWSTYDPGSFVMDSDVQTYTEPTPTENLLARGWDPSRVTAGFTPVADKYVLDPAHPNAIDLPLYGKGFCFTGTGENLTFRQAVTAPSAGSKYRVTLDVNTNNHFACFGVSLGGVAGTSYTPDPIGTPPNVTACATPTENVITAEIDVPLAEGQTVDFALATWTISAGRGNCGGFQDSYTLNDAQLVSVQ